MLDPAIMVKYLLLIFSLIESPVNSFLLSIDTFHNFLLVLWNCNTCRTFDSKQCLTNVAIIHLQPLKLIQMRCKGCPKIPDHCLSIDKAHLSNKYLCPRFTDLLNCSANFLNLQEKNCLQCSGIWQLVHPHLRSSPYFNFICTCHQIEHAKILVLELRSIR